MTLSYNGTTVESVVYNGTTLDHVIYNGTEVFTRLQTYSITVTLENATASASNPSTITEGSTATLVFTFDGTSYKCPTTAPTVTGATGSWTKDSDTQGTMVLSNPTANVSFTVVGEEISTGYTVIGTCTNRTATIYYGTSETSGYILAGTATSTGATLTVSVPTTATYLAFGTTGDSNITSFSASGTYTDVGMRSITTASGEGHIAYVISFDSNITATYTGGSF